jgi:(1->4)-alpha-D-glucan 1-alpha-D-glucosylmutase
MRKRARAVSATYRLQLSPSFDFHAAAGVVDYLAALGVSHLYLSPVLEARPGSTHGYDVVDHARVRAELGGEGGFDALAAEAARHGLGLVVDIVPNHMAIGAGNRWWWDVLENGPSSGFADHFDVDWDPPTSSLRNRVLLPVLGDHYGRIIEAGELQLVREGASFVIRYHEHRFPAGPQSVGTILARAAAACPSPTLGFLADRYTELPAPDVTDRERRQRRHRDLRVLQATLDRLLAPVPAGTDRDGDGAGEAIDAAEAIDAVVEAVNADLAAMHELLEQQSYRLAWWRTAASELDYRRFFDITELVALDVDQAPVFEAVHRHALGWVARGLVDGLRIDHVDGLRNPEAYLTRLAEAAPGAWVVVEKILEAGEELPAWPVAGTTGYDFLRRVQGLFVDPAGEPALSAIAGGFTGESAPYPEVGRVATRQVLDQLLAADVNRVTELLARVCEATLRHRDHPRPRLREVVVELVASFPVYRTYGRPGPVGGVFAVDDADRRHVEQAAADVRRRRPDLDDDLLDLVTSLLLGEADSPEAREFVARFQQLSGPAHAKGHEDTAFYRYHRFVAANEVGGDPAHLGVDPAAFHAANVEAARRWPGTMTTTATHDTKRGEDVRARLALLSEIPEAWGRTVADWSARHERYRHGGWPDRATEYLLYQTLVGAHPLSLERVQAFLVKAIREAKVHTSWTVPNPAYEEAVAEFAADVLGDEDFRRELDAFVAPLVAPGQVTALAQVLLKLTSPGIPDTYQGTELWDDSLVDPDNRRPVDFAARARLLAELSARPGLTPEEILARAAEGLPKLLVVHRALQLRRARPEVFAPPAEPGAGSGAAAASAAYRPLAVAGTRADHLVAFTRSERVVTLAPRLVLGLAGDWGDTAVALPPALPGSTGAWRDVLTGDAVSEGTIPVAKVLGRFPVALLSREEPDGGS